MTEDSLLNQLANRARLFHQNTGISQSQLARAINMEESNYSAFLSGRRGIGSEATCLLLKFTNMPRQAAIAKFSKPVRSSKIMELQENGQPLRFDNLGWVAQEGSQSDPVNSTNLVDTLKANTRTSIADLVSLLGQLDNVTRKTVIEEIVKAYPNPYGTTPNNGQRFSR